MPFIIYHLLAQSDHLARQTDPLYTPPTFAADGFIHCTADLPDLLSVANALFSRLPEPLICYHIDQTKLTSPVIYEPPAPVAGATQQPEIKPHTLFPHIYGPINRPAIIKITQLNQNANGTWMLPLPED